MSYHNKHAVHPNELEPGDRMAIKIVAVIGHANDWAAYEANSQWSDDVTATNGDKIDAEAARRLFPVCRHLTYRT